jgi:hypothetical protein
MGFFTKGAKVVEHAVGFAAEYEGTKVTLGALFGFGRKAENHVAQEAHREGNALQRLVTEALRRDR